MPSSQSPNGNQTIIPIDLETLKYSRNLPFFKSNGEIPGKKIPKKNEFCKRSHRSVRLYKIQVESEKCIFSFSGLTLFYDKNISDSVFTLNFQTYRFFDMKNQYPPIVEKSLKVIEHLIEKFGWFTIRVYQFPLTPGFETFLESMQRNLIRHGSFSWYMWAKFKNKDMVLLVHFGRGFWTGHF